MGVPFFPVANNKDGTLPIEAIEAAVKADNVHYPRTKLVALENTQNRCGGRVLTPEYCARVAEVCKAHGLALHLDGARIMNASVALGVPPDVLTESFDSVSVCLSKGLGAPVGSVIVGSDAFIYKVGWAIFVPSVLRWVMAQGVCRQDDCARRWAAECARLG
jgi:threonine aldolase